MDRKLIDEGMLNVGILHIKRFGYFMFEEKVFSQVGRSRSFMEKAKTVIIPYSTHPSKSRVNNIPYRTVSVVV